MRAFVLAGLIAWLACDAPDESPRDAAPISPRATLHIEPTSLPIGEVTTIEVVVVTPPDHRVLPYAPPSPPGLWLLDAEPLDPEREAQRWVHRTLLRVRPRELGRHTWPASRVVVETDDGSRQALGLPERSLEVVSVAPAFAGRSEPFGLQRLPTEGPRAGFWLGAGAGTLAGALATASLLAFRRRRGAGDASHARDPKPTDDALWQWAERELGAATAQLPADPRSAANFAATTLRRYAAARFRVDIESASTEEIALQVPPLRMRSTWPQLVAVLRRLDAERFRPSSAARERDAAEQTRRLGEEVRAFVEATRPREPRR